MTRENGLAHSELDRFSTELLTRYNIYGLLTHNIYIYIYIYIGRMNYCPLFRVRSLNNGVRCMSFCFLMSSLSICYLSNSFELFRDTYMFFKTHDELFLDCIEV